VTSAVSSALEYSDNISLTNSGNWVRSTQAEDIIYKDKDRLSQVGDNGQEENIDSDGGSVDLLKSTEDPVGDDLTSVKNCHM
jgi:hypothetical protein